MPHVATLAGGCFWCTEAVFQRLKGVEFVTSGYSGGLTENPTYEEVCIGKTGHAEAIQIIFDPTVIGFEKLLEVFWKTHDPTTLNRQGVDTGTQYRSVIFYHDEKQKEIALQSKEVAQSMFKDPMVTEVVAYKNFYPADASHKNYYNRNLGAAYCQVVIDPKIQKLMEEFGRDMKAE